MRYENVTGYYVTPNRWENPSNAQWLENDPWQVQGGLSNFRSDVGNDWTNAKDLSGLDFWSEIREEIGNKVFGPWKGDVDEDAKVYVFQKVSALHWPHEQKNKIDYYLDTLIDGAQFWWGHETGLTGKCNEWVDEYYPLIRPYLAGAAKVGINVYRVAWQTNTLGGHNGVKITVRDNLKEKGATNSFSFYLDDGMMGGSDHFFLASEIAARYGKVLDESGSQLLSAHEALESMNLKPPIGGEIAPGWKAWNPFAGVNFHEVDELSTIRGIIYAKPKVGVDKKFLDALSALKDR